MGKQKAFTNIRVKGAKKIKDYRSAVRAGYSTPTRNSELR